MAVTDARFRQHLRAGGELALLAYLDHPDGAVRVWSRIGTLNWDGHEWTGIGTLGRVSGLAKSTTLELRKVTFSLCGVPPTLTDVLTNPAVRNRSAKLWLAAIRKQRVEGQPYLIVDDLMDIQRLKQADDGSMTIDITVNVGFWSIERATNKAWTHEAQQQRFPGDSGLSQIPLLADKQSNWRQP